MRNSPDICSVEYIAYAAETLGFFQVVKHVVPLQLLEEVALEYMKTSTEMVKRLLHALMGNLGVKLDDSRLDALLGLRMVNMNFYPTCPNPDLTVGVRRHSDMGTLTMLLQDGIGGLYVKKGEDSTSGNEDWIEIPPVHGALVINIGDALQKLQRQKHICRFQMAPSFNDEKSLFNFVVKDGNGVKGLVDSGLTQVPGQYIQPPNHRINKQNATVSLENMTIDLSKLDGPNHDQVVKSIAHAAETGKNGKNSTTNLKI
nr:2-oxoglutarate (2OG) and Fe(II)-dependent oxygenase superfamily protein [Tanacetum cinerariifolium]